MHVSVCNNVWVCQASVKYCSCARVYIYIYIYLRKNNEVQKRIYCYMYKKRLKKSPQNCQDRGELASSYTEEGTLRFLRKKDR